MMAKDSMRISHFHIFALLLSFLCIALPLKALPETDMVAHKDTIVTRLTQQTDSIAIPEVAQPIAFKPDPTKAVWLGLIPGMGQIYNRKYWKLPIVYGGLMACIYAVSWNNGNYTDYFTAYKDILTDTKNPEHPESWKQSWQDLLPAGVDPANYVNDKNFQDALKRKKDFYRRYRDLSILISIGVYALTIVDAYVDAQLFDFDISEDLNLQVAPEVQPATQQKDLSYGLNCRITF